MIQSLGYQVLRAGSGREAIQIYQEQPRDIDLVILDMIMPAMDGIEVYYALKNHQSRC